MATEGRLGQSDGEDDAESGFLLEPDISLQKHHEECHDTFTNSEAQTNSNSDVENLDILPHQVSPQLQFQCGGTPSEVTTSRSPAYVLRILSTAPSVLQSLKNSVADRVVDRYITALHALSQSKVGAITWPAFRRLPIEKVASDLVISPDELRRSLALCLFSWLASRRILQKQTLTMSYTQIMNGMKSAPSSGRNKTNKLVQSTANVNVKRKRRREPSPMLGSSVREARDTLSAASWRSFQARERVFEMLRGEEIVSRIREEGLYEDTESIGSSWEGEVGLNGTIADSANRRTTAEKDDFLSAVRELPGADLVGSEALVAMSRKVEEFSFLLRRVPVVFSADKASEFLQTVHTSGILNGNGNSVAIVSRPSDVPYRMALYRTEALKWMSLIPFEASLEDSKRRMREQFRSYVKQDEAHKIHPFFWMILLQTYNSLQEVSMSGTKLRHFAGLIGASRRNALASEARKWQVEQLLSCMVTPNRSVAEKLVCNFLSASRSLRTCLTELEWVFGSEETAHVISQCMHGYHRDLHTVVARSMRLPYLASRVLYEEFENLSTAQVASFTAFVYSKTTSAGMKHNRDTYALTMDERLEAYQAVHGEERGSHEIRGRFEASWGLFREVCTRTNVRNCVEVTSSLLDEEQRGTAVLKRLATDSLTKTCIRVPTLNTDDAFRLRTFAYSFMPSSEGSSSW